MKSPLYDVIVLGLGAMGSASLYSSTKRGMKALGIERHTINHDFGSSHGRSRLIRRAYFEHPNYVPLLNESYRLWEQLEEETAKSLFVKTGLVIFGEKENAVIQGVRKASRIHKIPITEYTNPQSLFPDYKIPSGFIGSYEKDAGYLKVEDCIEAFTSAAVRRGATLQTSTEVLGWTSEKDFIKIRTSQGDFSARKLIVTAGPWTSQLLANMNLPLKVHRAPLFWFETTKDLSSLPCFAFALPYGFFYGFPVHDSLGLKVAWHKPLEEVENPSLVDRNVTEKEAEHVIRFVTECLKGVRENPTLSKLCLYTMTPDQHFILDSSDDKQIHYACGFSGHGFKFAPVIGEIMTDLASHGRTDYPIGFLRRERA